MRCATVDKPISADLHGGLRITGLLKFRAELADLPGDVKAEKRCTANIFSAIGLASIAVARRANDHEGLAALLRNVT
jgi:hypothetical protein